jgi:uncharacterized protein YfaS (alpha-2-macroglobulin family)
MSVRTFHTVFIFILLAFGCGGGKKTLKVKSVGFGDEVRPKQNLIFKFNRPVGKVTGEWEPAARYVRIEPQVAGAFRWIAADELVFSPAAGFSPATAYSAVVDAQSLQPLAADMQVETQSFSFRTPELKITRCDFYWTQGKRTGKPVAAAAALGFNYPVSSKELQKFLSAAHESKRTDVQIAGDAATADFDVHLPAVPATEGKSEELALNVGAGMPVPGAPQPTVKPLSFSGVLNDPKELVFFRHDTEHDGAEGVIRLYFSQAVVAGAKVSVRQKPPYYWDDPVPFDAYRVLYDKNHIELRGAFSPEQQYEIVVSEGLTGVAGGRIEEPINLSAGFRDGGALIQFTEAKSIYLSARGEKNIGIEVAGLNQFRLKVTKIYQNNLVPYFNLSGPYDPNDDHPRFELYHSDFLGDEIVNQLVEVQFLPQKDNKRYLNFDIADPKSDYFGAYVVSAAANDEYWTQTSRLVVVTDLGLVARRSEKEVMVFAHSLATAQPVSGATIKLVSRNNQTIAEGKTDSDGAAVLKIKDSSFEPAMVTAEKNGDFNFLYFRYTAVETSRFDLAGKPTRGRPYDVYLYGERNLYRPGETARIQAVVRDFQRNTPGGLPLTLKIFNPQGQTCAQTPGSADDSGGFHYAFPIPPDAPTGVYSVQVFTGDDALIGAYAFNVEEFLPDRLKITLGTDKPSYFTGENVKLELDVQRLYGAAASNTAYEIEAAFVPLVFAPKGYKDYDFTLFPAPAPAPNVKTGTTNAAGAGAQLFPIPAELRDAGKFKIRLYATAFDENGRPVYRTHESDLFTQKLFFGIKKFDRYVGLGNTVKIPLVVLTHDEKPTGAQARVKVYRREYETIPEQHGTGMRFVSKRRDVLAADQTVAVAEGGSVFAFTPQIPGEYEVQVAKPGAPSYVAREFFAYGGAETSGGFSVNPDGAVDIVPDKDAYLTGQKAKILFKTPFDGTLLVTLERDRVFEYRRIPTQNQTAEAEFSLKDLHLPNVYLTATLFRPMRDDGIPLTVAHGYKNLIVENPTKKLPLRIAAPVSTGSNTKIDITVTTSPGAMLTVAAVDEGILQIKNTPGPDPYAYFYAPHALESESYDLYAKLFPEIAMMRSKTPGSDAAGGIARRNNPFTARRPKLVSFFSGPVRADGNGQYVFSVPLPSFSGTLRVMAAAWKGDAFAGAEALVKVADPMVVTNGAPRFLSPGDTAFIPVTVANTTAQTFEAAVSLTAQGACKVVGASETKVNLGPNREQTVRFRVAAVDLGEATLSAKANQYGDDAALTVRPAAPLSRASTSGSIDNEEKILDFSHDYLPPTVRTRLVLSRMPVLEYGRDFTDLIEYPHGCAEQTVMTAFPQLYLSDLAKSLHRHKGTALKGKAASPTENVKAAIAKLQAMQKPEGGIAYWPGGVEINDWATVCAAHFLFEAQKAGYAVNPAVLSNLKTYLERLAVNARKNEYGDVKRYRRECLYALFVLAAMGEKPVPTMNFYRERWEELTHESRELLRGAYRLAGERAPERTPTDALAWNYASESGGSFASPVRDLALMVYVANEIGEKDEATRLARRLSGLMKQKERLNTQEAGFALLALSKLAQNPDAAATAVVTVDGKTFTAKPGEDLILTQNLAGKKVAVKVKGTMYYYQEIEGVPATAAPAVQENLNVKKSFFSRTGAPLDARTFQANDLVVVKLSVSVPTGETVHNVVVTDLLPACFEPENPRLTQARELPWIQDRSYPDYFDIRDDRIHFYATVSGTEKHFYYTARVTMPGRFEMGPAAAEAMYVTDYRAVSPSRKTTVLSGETRGM